MKDRSYAVLGATLRAISTYNVSKALGLAKDLEKEAGGPMVSAIATLYAQSGTADQLDFFLTSFDKVTDPNDKYVFVQIFGKYLMKQTPATQIKGLAVLEDIALNEGAWWMRISAIQVLMGMKQSAEAQASEEAKAIINKVDAVIVQVKATETNDMIKGMLGE